MKLIDQPKYSRCSAKESSVLCKRVIGALQKNRRCSAKESTVLSKRIVDAKRKQSIYSQKSLNINPLGSVESDKNIVKSQFFHWGVRKVFFLLPSCLCGFIWSNTVELGGFRKEVCYSDESQYPYEDSCESWGHSWQGRCPLAIYPNCHNVWIESFKTIPTDFLLSLYLCCQVICSNRIS